MIENLDIVYNVTGQSLRFDAPEGRPSSVTTSAVYENNLGDDSTAETITDGASAAVETSPDTTFDANSGTSSADPRVCNVAATTGITPGRRFLVTNAALETEWVDIITVVSGASCTARNNLRNDYVSADTLESTRITHAIDATWVAAKTNISANGPEPRYRWRLEYVVASVTYVHDVYFDLVRYAGTTSVTGLDVDRAYPWLGWMNRLSSEDQEDGGSRVIDEAYRQVKMKLAMAGKADEGARNREVMEDLVVHRAAMLVAGTDVDAAEAAAALFNESYNNFIVSPKLDFDDDGSGAAAPSDPAPVWVR